MYHREIRKKIREQLLLHSVMLELTYSCNLNCFFCYNDRKAAGNKLSVDQYKKLFEDLAGMQVLFLTFTGGEPLVHPEFFAIGRAAREKGFVIRIKSNGLLVDRSSARRLKEEINPVYMELSLHGSTPEVHDRMTGSPGSLKQLKKNIRILQEEGVRCSLVSTLTSWNEDQVGEMFSLADSLGASLRFQGPVGARKDGNREPMQIQPTSAGWDSFVSVARQREASGSYQQLPAALLAEECGPEPEDGFWCGAGLEEVIIDPFGTVFPCLHLRWPAGNIHETSIEEIWKTSQVFPRARSLSRSTAEQMQGIKPRQYGAPLYCPGLALEEQERTR